MRLTVVVGSTGDLKKGKIERCHENGENGALERQNKNEFECIRNEYFLALDLLGNREAKGKVNIKTKGGKRKERQRQFIGDARENDL